MIGKMKMLFKLSYTCIRILLKSVGNEIFSSQHRSFTQEHNCQIKVIGNGSVLPLAMKVDFFFLCMYYRVMLSFLPPKSQCRFESE